MLLLTASQSPYLARILAVALLTWADAYEEWLDALRRHWGRKWTGIIQRQITL